MLSRAGLEPQLSISQKLPQNYQFPFATGFRLLSPPSRNQSPERQKRAQVQIPASRSSKTRIPNVACLLPKPTGSGFESLSQRKVNRYKFQEHKTPLKSSMGMLDIRGNNTIPYRTERTILGGLLNSVTKIACSPPKKPRFTEFST